VSLLITLTLYRPRLLAMSSMVQWTPWHQYTCSAGDLPAIPWRVLTRDAHMRGASLNSSTWWLLIDVEDSIHRAWRALGSLGTYCSAVLPV
jgi:hypothetical protein